MDRADTWTTKDATVRNSLLCALSVVCGPQNGTSIYTLALTASKRRTKYDQNQAPKNRRKGHRLITTRVPFLRRVLQPSETLPHGAPGNSLERKHQTKFERSRDACINFLTLERSYSPTSSDTSAGGLKDGYHQQPARSSHWPQRAWLELRSDFLGR
jgi:hypothetical protein